MPNSYSALFYHLVFATKYREPRLHESLRTSLYQHIGGVVSRRQGALLAIGGIEDHVHLLLGLRTDHTLAREAQHIKGSSSRWWNTTGLDGDRPFAWQVGFGAFTVSQSQVPTVRQYIQRQEEHHRNVSFDSEWKRLLQRHGVDSSSGLGWAPSPRQGLKPHGYDVLPP